MPPWCKSKKIKYVYVKEAFNWYNNVNKSIANESLICQMSQSVK